MDSLFGVPLTNILVGLLISVGAIFGVLGFIAWRNPILVRMGFRNIARRRIQTALIVVGLMLSTLIMSAAFATGDTVGYSVTNTIYEELGEADVIVVLDDAAAGPGVSDILDEHVDAVRGFAAGDADIDGVTAMVQTSVPALNPDARLSEPRATFVGIDPESVDDLNGLVAADGSQFSARDLGPGQAYVTEELADEVQVAAGGTLTVFYANEPKTVEVAGVVRDNAITSQAGGGAQQQGGGGGGSPGLGSGGGIVVSLDTFRSIAPDRGFNLVVVSATGGVRDTVDLSEVVADRLEDHFAAAGLPLQVATDKAQLVGFAELIGSLFVTFFLVFGLFSIAAGIMLIFLTFVMLAAERRSEMGMARAVGMKRLHLTESFIAEGMAYNIGSALVGATLGLAVAWGLITVMGSVLDDFGLEIAFHVSPTGFLISYCLGVVITFVTVAVASWRSANLNIVRAIRDIPEPEVLRGHDTSLSGLFTATVGAAWYAVWIAMLGLGVLALFYGYIFSLALYGLPFILVALLIAGYIWGLRQFGRPRSGRRTLGLVAWWVAFNVIAAIGFFLVRTKGWADRHRTSGGWAVLMLVVGALATWWGGWVSGQAFAYTAGTTLMLLAVAMLLVYFGSPARPTFSIISGLTIWYWLLPLPFSLLFEAGDGWNDPLDGLFGLVGLGHEPITASVEIFFVSGVSITAASTLFVIFNADRLLGALGLLRHLLGGITPAVRTAISYPLASKFRTGITLAMFTLVMFSLVVMATLNHNFAQLFLGDAARGGWDVMAVANPNNPIGDLEAAVAARDPETSGQAALVGRMVTGPADVKPATEDDEFHPYLLSGLDDAFLEGTSFEMSTIAAGYADSAAVLEALRTDPSVAVINESVFEVTQRQSFQDPDEFFSIEGSVGDLKAGPWEPIPITVEDRRTGEERTVHAIAVVESAVISGIVPQWLSIFVSDEFALEVIERPQEVFFLQAPDGDESSEALANTVESALLEQGVQAVSLRQLLRDSTAQQSAFSNLFVAFMSLGLVVGIAALGVIAFRTVAERRQQIGMLRAIGYSRRLVAVSFFLESSFIALTGIAMGLVLGGALSYNLMTSPEFTNGQEVDFSYPVGTILVIIAIAYFATAVMTVIPARSASRVAVAEALRYSA